MEREYPIRLPEGFQTSAGFPNLTDALVKRGYADADVRKIMGGNLLRPFGSVWRA
jgi:membrane dipeptidase